MGKHSTGRDLIGTMTMVDPVVERFKAEVVGLLANPRYRVVLELKRQGHDHFDAEEMADQAILAAIEEGFAAYE